MEILTNKALWVPAVAWCTAQILKVLIALIREKKINFSYMIQMGRMPSAHAALVCALATTVAVTDGLGSVPFAITALLALIVMYDAAGIRQAVSEQSTILNRMLDELFQGRKAFEQRMKEFIGHSKLEVMAGAGLGILMGWLLTIA